MEREIRAKLIELARNKSSLSYSQLNDQLMLGLNFKNAYHRELIGDFLGDISMYEHKKGRPLLSALVIHKSNDKVQGNGFYKLCAEIYKKDWEVLKSEEEELTL